MSSTRFQQQIYDFLHDTKELPKDIERKVKHYFARCNFFRKGDPWRNSWYNHKRFKDKNNI
jgi:hypothetical protein